MGRLPKNLLLMLRFPKALFLVLLFSSCTLMVFLMILLVIFLLSMLMILLSTLSVIELLIYGNSFSWLWNLNLAHKKLDLHSNWLRDYSAKKLNLFYLNVRIMWCYWWKNVWLCSWWKIICYNTVSFPRKLDCGPFHFLY